MDDLDFQMALDMFQAMDWEQKYGVHKPLGLMEYVLLKYDNMARIKRHVETGVTLPPKKKVKR